MKLVDKEMEGLVLHVAPRKPRKRNPRTTRGRNPPAVAPPPVMGYGGGPTDLSLLPSYGN
jgi:hypothetical protein